MKLRTLPDCEAGERWAIAQGDVLTALPLLDAEAYDAILTDVPYSSGGQFRGDRAAPTSTKYQASDTAKVYPDFYGDTRDQRALERWCAMWMAEAWRLAKPQAILGTFIDWRNLGVVVDAIQIAGWTFRGIAVWRKTIARPQTGRFTQEAEFFPWASKGELSPTRWVHALPGAWEAEDVPFGQIDIFEGHPRGWWNVPPVPGVEREHLTEKPVALLREIVRVVEGDGLILDPFAGAGSYALAAKLEHKRCDMLELGADYKRIAARRLREHDAQAERGAYDRAQLGLLGGAAADVAPAPRPSKSSRGGDR